MGLYRDGTGFVAMIIDAKQLIIGLLKRLLLATVVFLPIFFIANVAELKFRGVALSGPAFYHLSAAVVLYVEMLLPVLLGAIAHTATLLLIPLSAAASTRRIANVVLAPVLPITVILSSLAPYLSDYLGSVVCGRWRLMHIRSGNR